MSKLPGRLVGLTAIGFLVLGALGMSGAVDARAALALSVLLGLALAASAFRHLRDGEQVVAWIRRLLSDADAPAPAVDTLLGGAVVQMVRSIDRKLRDRLRRLGHEAATASAVLDSLNDPVVMLAADRRALRGNEAARRLFGDRLTGRDIVETLRQPEILKAVDAVLGGAAPISFTLSLPVPIERVFEVRVQPVDRGETPPEESGDAPAAVLSFHDQTAIRRSEQMRADFVTNASHELKTPLASLIGFIETLRGPARDDAQARDRFLGIMQQQANRMARLVSDLLSLSRIEVDEHVQPTAPVDVAAVVRTVADGLEPKAAARTMRIVVDAAPDLPRVPGDPDQLHQVFQNLMDNALAYGRPGTEVRVVLRRVSGRRPEVAVAVEDQGEGIARHHLPRLTERFYRVDPARSRAVGGTGLGLAIVKHIVSRHRGRLDIDSEIGRGTTLTVHLPAAEAGSARPGWRAAS